MVAKGVPTLSYGLRGVTALKSKSPARKWICTRAFSAALSRIRSRRWRDCLRLLHDENGHVAIEGFYDNVKPLEDWEREAWRKLPIDGDKEFCDETGSPELFGEKGYSTLERIWGRPTAEINGIGGGYQGQGTKTVIASHAMAKLTFRLVPDQEGDEILELAQSAFGKTFAARRDDGNYRRSQRAVVFDRSAFAIGEAAQRALKAFGKDPALIREGGSIPIVSQFREHPGVETLLMGLALPDCRAHSPNENFPLENLEAGIRLNKAVLATGIGTDFSVEIEARKRVSLCACWLRQMRAGRQRDGCTKLIETLCFGPRRRPKKYGPKSAPEFAAIGREGAREIAGPENKKISRRRRRQSRGSTGNTR